MNSWQLSEPVLRLSAFLGIFALLAILELVSPRLQRPQLLGALKKRRWFTNISIVILSSVLLRLVFPAAAVGTALWTQSKGWGIFNHIALDPWISGIIAFVVLDLAIWVEHFASHKIHLLWRIHRMHHSDTGFDVTTALRFHPLEILLSMLWKALVVTLLGAPVAAVLIFEIVLNGSSMFNHSNYRLPLKIDRWLRLILVTPDMHRVHHSNDKRETDSNYGFNFPFWDRIFRTYSDQPRLGHDDMKIGLKEYSDPEASKLTWALAVPFRSDRQR